MKKILGLVLLVAFYGLQAGKITLQSNDGKEFKIDQEKAEKSITLKHMLEDLKEEELAKLNEAPIPFPNINGDTLEAIVNCLQAPEDTEGIIASLSGKKLYAFNLAVNYLDIPEIYEKLPAIHWLKQKLLGQIIAGPVLSGHGGIIFAVAISSDGKFIVAGSHDGTARIWNIDGTERAVLKGHGGPVNSVAISPDSKFIVTGSDDKTARIWNIDGTERTVLRGHTGKVTSVAISADGKLIVAGSRNGIALIWNIDGTVRTELMGNAGEVNSVAISPDKKFIVAGYWDGIALIWDIDGTKRAVLRGDRSHILALAISPDNKFIVAGAADGMALIWNIDGIVRTVLSGHKSPVRSVAISPDGKFIVTGSDDNTARIWNIDGTVRAVLKGHTSGVTSVAISADGTFIVTGSADGTARIWYIGNPEHVKQLNIDQINLITKIYEQVQNKQKLDLLQKSTDTLKIRAQNKVEENLFRTLPSDIQAVLHDDVIVP